jgi:hypothetical protein
MRPHSLSARLGKPQDIRPQQIEAPESQMIRNRRTTFATCTDSVDTPTVRSDMPRLAAPIVYDITRFHLPLQNPECPHRRKMLPKDTRSRTHQR